MKKHYFLLIALVITAVSFAQKKEKIKGSKIVTVTQKDVEPFQNLEINDNLEIFIIKGDKQSIEIEADDNLHDVLKYEMNGNTLQLSSTKEVTGAKKFSVRVTYTNDLKLITVRSEAQLNSLADLQGDNFTVKNYDYSKSYLNVKATYFTLIMNDRSKAELNAKSDLLQKPYSMELSMKYEDPNATQVEGSSSISIPVKQDARFEISNFDAGVRMCVSKTVKFVIQGCAELIRQIGDTCRRSRVTPFGCIAHIRYIGDQKFACASVVQFIHQSPNISWCIC